MDKTVLDVNKIEGLWGGAAGTEEQSCVVYLFIFEKVLNLVNILFNQNLKPRFQGSIYLFS